MANKLLNDYFKDNNDIERLILKCSVRRTSNTTEKPVENGVDITDHVILQPITLSLDFVLTHDYEQSGEILHSSGIMTDSTFKVAIIKSAYEKLDDIVKLQYDKELLDFVDESTQTTYNNLQITEISNDSSKDISNGVHGTIGLKQINTAISITTYDLGTYQVETGLGQGAGDNNKGDTANKDKETDESIIAKMKDFWVESVKKFPSLKQILFGESAK